MNWSDWAWLLWGAVFVVLEMLGMNGYRGAHTLTWFITRYVPTIFLAAFTIWFGWHFFAIKR
jgi:membrane protein implicated in regulation of membrane protease activity